MGLSADFYKANVLRSYAFFRTVFDEIALEYPDIESEHCLVDAMTVILVRRPSHYDVIVTENMFGDIISDLGAATIGGMGMAPAAEIGAAQGLFQAAHGSAPDIAGCGVANPYGTILSAAMMLDWLADRHGDVRLSDAARRIEAAVDVALSGGSALVATLVEPKGPQRIVKVVCGVLLAEMA